MSYWYKLIKDENTSHVLQWMEAGVRDPGLESALKRDAISERTRPRLAGLTEKTGDEGRTHAPCNVNTSG